MRKVHLERSQPLLPLRGKAMDWQRLPATVREAVALLLSQLLAQQVRPANAGRSAIVLAVHEGRRGHER